MINYAVEGGHPKSLEDVNSLVPTTCFVVLNNEHAQYKMRIDCSNLSILLSLHDAFVEILAIEFLEVLEYGVSLKLLRRKLNLHS